MPSCTVVRRLLVGSFSLLLPVHAALAQPLAKPTDAEVHGWIERLEQKKDQPARLQALKWFQKHDAAKNARLAIPSLEQTIRADPDSKLRQQTIVALFDVARKQKLPCPLTLVQALFDQEASVRQYAAAVATQFTTFAPGTVEPALRASWSEDAYVRSSGLHLLALAAPRDEKALAVLETAKNDRSFQVRHDAYCFKFQVSDRLDEYLAWLIRVQEDESVLQPIPNDEELRKREEYYRSLYILHGTRTILDWCEKRPDELAAALVQLLDHKSPAMRHGAVRLIGVTAVKSDLSNTEVGKEYLSKVPSYLFPDSESGASKPGNPPKPRLEKSKVAACLEKRKVRERLDKLSKNDPDRAVQGAALLALDRLARLQVEP